MSKAAKSTPTPLLSAEEQAVVEAVETLYDIFSVYPLAQKVEGCPCCVSAEDEAALHLRPLRRMTAQDLRRYLFKALTTWGDADDFRHFLPRLLELAAETRNYDVDLEEITRKLEYAKWQQWPEQEQQTVRLYLSALWQFVLTLSPEEVWLDDYIGAIGQAEENLAPYLKLWQDTTTDTAFTQLAVFFDSQLNLHRGKLTNWGGRKEQMTQVINWFAEMGLS
jgi:hypothetical protein